VGTFLAVVAWRIPFASNLIPVTLLTNAGLFVTQHSTDIGGAGGPIGEVYFPSWKLGLYIQAGYGTSKQYGEMSVFKQFDWTE
jgi:hypothetical protein